jgi:hypothetical protein
MDVSRIDSVQSYGQTRQVNNEQAKKRLALHESSSFAKGASGIDLSAIKNPVDAVNNSQEARILRTRDGQEIEIPTLDAETRAKAAALYAKVSEAGRQRLQLAGLEVGRAAFAYVAATRAMAKGEPTGRAQLEAATSALYSAAQANLAAVANEQYGKPPSGLSQSQFNNAMTDAMTNGMAGVEGDLNATMQRFYEKAQMSETVDTDIAELNDMLANWPEGSSQSFTWHEAVKDENGNYSIVEKSGTLTKEQAEDLKHKLDAEANGLNSMSAIEMQMLQVQVQDYQQAMTTLSNVMKAYDDNLKGIIQNVKA